MRGPDLARAAAPRAALEETVIAGVATNADLLHGIVSSEAFLARPWDTGFVAAHLEELRRHRLPAESREPRPATGQAKSRLAVRHLVAARTRCRPVRSSSSRPPRALSCA